VELEQLRLSLAERHFLEALQRVEGFVGPQFPAAGLPASLLAAIRLTNRGLWMKRKPWWAIAFRRSTRRYLECVLTTYIRSGAGRRESFKSTGYVLLGREAAWLCAALGKTCLGDAARASEAIHPRRENGRGVRVA